MKNKTVVCGLTFCGVLLSPLWSKQRKREKNRIIWKWTKEIRNLKRKRGWGALTASRSTGSGGFDIWGCAEAHAFPRGPCQITCCGQKQKTKINNRFIKRGEDIQCKRKLERLDALTSLRHAVAASDFLERKNGGSGHFWQTILILCKFKKTMWLRCTYMWW